MVEVQSVRVTTCLATAKLPREYSLPFTAGENGTFPTQMKFATNISVLVSLAEDYTY